MIFGNIAILILPANNKILEITYKSLYHSILKSNAKNIDIIIFDNNLNSKIYNNDILNALNFIEDELAYKYDLTLIVQNNTFFIIDNIFELENHFFCLETKGRVYDNFDKKLFGVFSNASNFVNNNLLIINNNKFKNGYFKNILNNIYSFNYDFKFNDLLKIFASECFYIEDINFYKNYDVNQLEHITLSDDKFTYEILNYIKEFKNTCSFTLLDNLEVFEERIYFQKHYNIESTTSFMNDVFLFLMFVHFKRNNIFLEDINLDYLKPRLQYINCYNRFSYKI